jgi:hypothetical protein
MNVITLNDKNILPGLVDSSLVDYFGGSVDNSIIGLTHTVLLAGDVLLLKVIKDEDTDITAVVENDIIKITGHYAFSGKDDLLGALDVVGIVNGAHSVGIINKDSNTVILVIVPDELL